MVKFTQEVMDYIIEIHKGKSNIEVSELVNKKFNMNTNRNTIQNAKTRYKNKTGYIFEVARNDGYYKKGNTPFNKGTKGFMKKNKTSFKKGNIPSNAVPIGSERINCNGYVYVKIADGKGNDNWKLKARIVLEEKYGKIPEKTNIIYADGNKQNVNIENLRIVSNSEEMYLNINDYRGHTTDIVDTGILMAKINNKVKELEERK